MFGLLHSTLTSRPVSFEHSSEDLQIPPSNYRNHLRRASTFHATMNNHIQDPPSKETNSLGKDTGFPEPLSEDRNTTLPHPDADTSPNATMEAPDVDLTRTHSRRAFFRHHKGNSFTNKDLSKSVLYDNIEYAGSSREENGLKDSERDAEKGDDAKSPSSDGSSSLDGNYGNGGERKRGLFKKLGFS